MVVVGVGDEYGVDLAELLLQHLLAEVGTAVYQQAGVLRLQQC